jgi:opacity protein-like surface antigen
MKLRLLLASLLLVPLAAQAQLRTNQWEGYFFPTVTDSKNYTFEGGTSVRQDTGVGFGFGFAKNLNPNFNLGGELSWGSANYRATVQPGANNNLGSAQNINGYIESYTVRFSGTYYVLQGNFSPFVTGGLGWTYIDTNIPNSLPQNYCWYYPWYGQVCGSYVSTAATTRFSYNAGAGVRYDFTREFFMRGWVNAQYVDFGGNYGGTRWTQGRVDFGFKF